MAPIWITAVYAVTAGSSTSRPRAFSAIVRCAVLETGSGSEEDLLGALHELLPPDDRWRHSHGSRGHGRSHVMPALIPPYCTVPVIGGRLALGTWQSICLVDLNVDNAVRTVRVSMLRG